MKRIIIIILLIFVVIGTYLIYTRQNNDLGVRNEPNETIYSIGGIPIEFEVYHGINEGVWRIRSASDQPLGRQIEVIGKLLDRALSDQKKPPRTQFIGRLEEAIGNDREMSKRLALAAKGSNLWDANRGRAMDRNDNRTVTKILNDAGVCRELTELFRTRGLEIKVSGVEKVLIGDDRLPFDCMTFFSVSSLKGGRP